MAHLPEWASSSWVQRMNDLQPELFQRFVEFEEAVYRPGALSTKVKELMAVGITHVTQCDACIEYHTRRAKEEGASDEEIVEAVFVAMELRAGAALGHHGASAKAMEQHRRREQKDSMEHRDERLASSCGRSEP
jgi:AhpD family alkylhydroperoxidase